MTMEYKKYILAINGGSPVFAGSLPSVHVADKKEIAAATRVIRKGPLSGFLGAAGPHFLGGEEVKAFENEFAEKFKIKYAVSFNSATTALHAAVAALGIGPGDEVIVPAYTLTATATAVLMNGAVPIFADIDERTFCVDPKSVEKQITKRTKAIMVVNIQGQGADFESLLSLAKKYKLALIEDNAQSPGATWRGTYLGTIGDIGVFSLNVNKTIQTGEGGVLVTHNPKYALRAQLSRNHGEAVVAGMSDYDGDPIFGSNYRMTEVTAAMARVQLRRLDFLTKKRVALVQRLQKSLANIPGLILPYVPKDNTHVYYRFVLRMDEKKLGISREKLFAAMAAEGFPLSRNIGKPLYLLPLFQQRKAFNTTHFPFDYCGMKQNYKKGICPVTENLCAKETVSISICQYPRTTRHIDLFAKALKKVLAYKEEIQ